MKRIFLAVIAFLVFSSHIMYLKFDTYFLKPNKSATIQLFNGTFDKSENVIDRNRMLDASLLGNGSRIQVNESQWSEKDSITFLNFRTGEEGTYVAGVSTTPNSIEMDAEAFNTYLTHEGIKDMLEWRRSNDAMDSAAVEKYSKHVKAIFQVGNKRTDDWQTALGYPIEFIPLDNPYDLNTGDELKFKLLLNGKPLANQLVYANHKATADGHSHDGEEAEHSHGTKKEDGHSHDAAAEEHSHGTQKAVKGHSHDGEEAEHSHGTKKEDGHSHDSAAEEHSHDTKKEDDHSHDAAAEHSHDAGESHTHTSGQELRTDSAGMATAKLTADGIWYLQTIHLVNMEEEGMTHESNWSTLTFEVVHGHGEDTHTHQEEGEVGIPSYAYWIGSIFLIGILFFWFNKKN